MTVYQKGAAAIRPVGTMVARRIISLAIPVCIWTVCILADTPGDPFADVEAGDTTPAPFASTL